MSATQIRVSTELATRLVRQHVRPGLNVTAVRQLHGGMVNRVVELMTDGEPASVVAKFNDVKKADGFVRELRVLRWYREHTRFPVPRPIATFNGDSGFPGSGLLMEKVDGPNLADARISPRAQRALQRELAGHVAALHSYTRATYGPALEPAEDGKPRWLDLFRPTIEHEFEAVKHLISSKNRWAVAEMIRHLDEWLPESGRPTLVHGDLWSTNILVDDRHPDRPQILAFVDAGASYCDAEYELAYLRIFRTASDDFFEAYAETHPIRPGFDRRCRVYWLNTIMLHVRLFGDAYLPRCEDLAGQIRRLS